MREGDGIWVEGERELQLNMQRVLGDNLTAAREAIRAAGLDIINDAKTNLRKNGSIATGQLRKSGRVQAVEGDEDAIDAGFFSEGQGYAAFVEYGTRAGGRRTIRFLLPLIKQWMSKKGIGDNGADFNDRAFFITRKIVRNGTQPRPFFAPAVEKNKKEIEKAIKEAIANDINKNGNR
jgi:hypothetical protein